MRLARKHVTRGLILLSVLLLGSWLAYQIRADRDSRGISFPDGSRAHYLGAVRSGTTFTADAFWARPLRRVLPSSWQRWLPATARITCGSGNTNNVVVYFRWNGVLSTSPFAWHGLVAVDDDGFRYPISGGSCSTATGNLRVYGMILRGFPRRQKSFRLEFLDRNHEMITQTRVPNPLPYPPAEQKWMVEHLPITHTNGEFAVTLVSVYETTNQGGSHLSSHWQKHALNPHWQHAQPGPLEITDAVGNEGGFLPRKEPVWRLTATFRRERPEDFEPQEKLVVTNLAMLSPGEMVLGGPSQDCAGVLVQLDGVYGGGALYITNGLMRTLVANQQPGGGSTSDGKTTVDYLGSQDRFFLVQATGLTGRDELHFHLSDDQGREIKLSDEGGYRYRNIAGSNARVYQRSFELVNVVKSLTLEIMVSRAKEFVFYINPADITPPQPSKP